MKHSKVGSPPGSLVYTGRTKEEVEITIFDYNEKEYKEIKAKKIEEIFPYKDTPTITWINITGLHKVEMIEKLGKHYNIHPLVLEDILNVDQRPKIEDFGEYMFIVVRMLSYERNEVKSEQVSIIFGKNFVFTFQERKGDVFEPVRERIRNNKGIIRKMGSNYLVYSLIDVIVDNYFTILEKIGEEIEELEDKVIFHPTQEIVRTIHHLKRNLIILRKSIWPLREVLSTLERGESQLIKNLSMYFRDIYDHTIQIIDTLETYRDFATGLLDIYLSSLSNRTNEIMKVLTIIGTIFIPLTFITGIYGMNFKYMPELKWKYGYPMVLFVMLVLSIIMLLYFRKKKWI